MPIPNMDEVEGLVRQAGAVLRERYGETHQITRKGALDLVTEADHAAEDLIVGALRQRYPDHTILTEERGHLPGQDEYTWYLDPLDGTVNYAHGLPIFCVSLALARGSELLLGAIYEPLRDACYTAERGSGAWCGGERLQVSVTADLARSLLVTGFPHQAGPAMTDNVGYYGRFSPRCQGVRRLGSAALDICYVAQGWIDGYWEASLNPWDIAAGALIAAEAGALVTGLRGQPFALTRPCSILAANPSLHQQMLAVLLEP